MSAEYTPDRHVQAAGRTEARIQAGFHSFVSFLARRGISLMGTRLLSVRGRTSGQERSNPVNLRVVGVKRYLLTQRGRTQWARNSRAAGGGELRLGRRVEEFTVTELADEDKLPALREYFRKCAWEVSAFFDGLTKHATDDK